jgi:diguanylate cyclase (GGDEF)-like protein/PAS domain S-box-containing protein
MVSKALSLHRLKALFKAATSHTKAKGEPQKNEVRYRPIVDTASDAVITITPDGIVYSFDREGERIFGYRAEEVIGQPVTLLMPERFRDLCTAGLRRYLETREARVIGGTTELLGLRKDGSEFLIELSLNEMHEGESLLFRAIIRDISERKQADNTLPEAQDYFRNVFDYAPIGLALVSVEGRYLQVNQALCEMLGYSAEELRATTWQAICHPDDLAASLDYVWRIKKGENPRYHLEKRYLRADGHEIWVWHSFILIEDSEGHPLYFIANVQDITERIQTEEALERSKVNLANAQEMTHLGSWEWNRQAGELHWSDELYRILGFGPQEFVPTHERFLSSVHPEDKELVERAFRQALSEGKPYDDIEFRVIHPDGSERTVQSRAHLIFDEAGRSVTTMLGTAHDVTERKQYEETLERLKRQNELVLNSAGQGIYGLDLQGNATFVNPAAARITGWEIEELLGQSIHDVLHHTKPDGTPYPKDECPAYAALRDRAIHSSDDEVFWRKNGTSFPVEYMSTPILEGDKILGAVVTFNDITERKALEEQLQHQAFHDSLTGLSNRALFMDRLKHALAHTRQGEHYIAVLFMDLDNFKLVNDSLGHEMGDQLLIAVAERLKACLRLEDTIARLGGDEFAILLEDIKAESDAVDMAMCIAEELQTPFVLGEREVFSTSSIGIALGGTSSNRRRAEDLLRLADMEMYRAKSKGWTYSVGSGLGVISNHALKRLELAGDLRRAIERWEFRVYYQPMVALEDSSIVGMEALVRWEHPARGLLLPSEFIGAAEETGLIFQLGKLVLEAACWQARMWREQSQSTSGLVVWVNLSAKQFRWPDLNNEVAEVLQKTGLHPSGLGLEITEGVAMEDAQATYATLRELEDLGVHMAIDDFGTGYSSLSYLRRFPVELLKIDRSFVREVAKDPKDTNIVSAIITLAQALDLKVIAEGVETAEQLRELRKMKCGLVQGYYFSEPLPSEEASALLEQQRCRR